MRKLLLYLGHKHEEVFRLLLVLSSIGLIVFCLPKEGKFKFEFQKGKPWMHETLVAPFDFAISKGQDEINRERNEIVKNAPLYYKTDTTLITSKINEFNREFDLKWAIINTSGNSREKELLRKSSISILLKLFDKGIIETGNEISTFGNPRETIVVLKGRVAEEKKLYDIYTIESAYDFIEDKLNKDKKLNTDWLSNLLETAVTVTITFDEYTTRQFQKNLVDKISSTRGLVQTGDIIIQKGEVIDGNKFQVISSLKSEYEHKKGSSSNSLPITIGQFMLVTIAFIMLLLFLWLFRKEIFFNNLKLGFIILIVVLMILSYVSTLKSSDISGYALYLMPFCIVPILIRAFFDTRLALFVHLVIVLILGFFAPDGFEFVFYQVIAGMVSIFSIANLRNRSQLFIAGGYIMLVYIASYIGISIIHEGSFQNIEWINIWWFVGNAILTLFAYPFIYLFEKMFGFTSDVTLLELSYSNSPLLKEMASKATGTFQHSLQVANLAESAIYEIGGNTLLVRAGALYHDIGKMDMPMYFIENQNTQLNPHDDLSFDESAKIIISHVIRGIEKAKVHKLPEQLIDFIRTHHGTTMVQYFYQSFLKNYPDKIIDEDMFRYPGPIPFSKETAVLMMADSVEAASRSLKKHDAETLDHLVDKIIDNQISQKQFVNSNITFRDITAIRKIFKKMLTSLYHVRIEYIP